MELNKSIVKTKRTYDATGRQERAQATRQAIVEAARLLFLRDGYTATTVSAVAAAVRVSVETIYKGFGGKSGLVRAIVERGLTGEGPLPAAERSDHIRETESDPRQILAAWGRFTTKLSPAVAPVLLLAREAAASDQEMAAVLEELNAERLNRMTFNARRLHEAGHLRRGVTPRQAADILWTYSSPELYELLVVQRGWTAERYGRFVGDAMIAALL